jgi:hypothetical protein
MRNGNKKCIVLDIDEGDGFLPLRTKQREVLLVAGMLLQRSELRLVGKMRENHGRVFHAVIIASLCCIVLSGCGYKTDPVYVADMNSSQQSTK